MNYYFKLQYKRLKRKIEAFGIPLLLALILMLLFFAGASTYLFYATDFAAWIYVVLAFSVCLKLGEKHRNEQLEIIFKANDYQKIRISENLLVALPFVLFLVAELAFLAAFLLVLLAVALAFWATKQRLHFVLPTPFKKWPFEYIVGFRKTLWLLVLLYFVLLKAIQVDNFNLAIVTLGASFLLGMSYYLKPEKVYFVWIYAADSKQFLYQKIKQGLLAASILSAPMLLLLGLFFQQHIMVVLLVQLLGYIFLISMILAKYSAFPKEINLPQAILYALSLSFPPLLLIVIPIFYKQAKARLNTILK